MDAKIDQQTVRLLFKNQMEVLMDLTTMAITQVLSYDFGTEENLQFCSYLDRQILVQGLKDFFLISQQTDYNF